MTKMLKQWIAEQKNKKRYARGLELMHNGRQKQAIMEFTEIIEENNKFFDAYLGRAIVYMGMERWDDGINDLTYLIDNLPEMAAAYHYRCVGYMGLRQMDIALSDINKAIDLDSNEPANYMRRGAIYFWMKKYVLSIEDTTKSINLGFIEDGYNNRAIYFEGMGDFVSAIADWSALIDIFPENAIAYCRRGLLREKIGDLPNAILDIKKGLAIGNNLEPDFQSMCKKFLDKYENAIRAGK